MQSTESGYFFIKEKNPIVLIDKLKMRKYDPVVRRHVLFTEKKMHSHAAKK